MNKGIAYSSLPADTANALALFASAAVGNAHLPEYTGEAGKTTARWLVERNCGLNEIEGWVRRILAAAYAEEGADIARASFTRASEDELVLRWDGTFTEGRWLEVYLLQNPQEDGSIVLHSVTLWDTGTGKVSTWLPGTEVLEYATQVIGMAE